MIKSAWQLERGGYSGNDEAIQLARIALIKAIRLYQRRRDRHDEQPIRVDGVIYWIGSYDSLRSCDLAEYEIAGFNPPAG